MKYVDLTPRWVEILPTWLMMVKQAAAGDCTNPDLVLDNATKEFFRMAEAADKFNDLARGLKYLEPNGEHTIDELMQKGRELRESDRHTVKESSDA